MKNYSLLIIGVLSLIAGVLAGVNPFGPSFEVMILLGCFYVVLGSSLFFSDKRLFEKATGNFVALFAAFMLITGIALIVNPETGAPAITIFIGFLLFISGIVRFAFSFSFDGVARGAILISAILSIVLASRIIADFPPTATRILDVILSLELILEGVAAIGLWAAHDSLRKDAESDRTFD